MWLMTSLEDTRHVVPVEDYRDHQLTLKCWCHPHLDDEDERIIIHTSMDQRELHERGERLVQ